MKSNVQTLSSASHRVINLAEWLNANHAVLSQLLGCPISNKSFVGVIAFTLFAVLAIIFSSDSLSAYGWAAFFALAAVNAVRPLWIEFKEGGRHE